MENQDGQAASGAVETMNLRSFSDVARALRAIPSEKRSEQSRANGRRGGRPLKAISEIACTCGADDSPDGHGALCPRGRAIKRRREKRGEAVEWPQS